MIEKRLFFLSLFLFIVFKVVIAILPFKYYIKFIKRQNGKNETSIETLKIIRTAIQRASNLTKFKNNCLVSSMTARYIASKMDIKTEFHIGAKMSVTNNNSSNVEAESKTNNKPSKIDAHAWLTAGEYEIVKKGTSNFKELLVL